MITLNTQQHFKEDILILSCYFNFLLNLYLTVFFFIISFQTLMHKEISRLLSILNIAYL